MSHSLPPVHPGEVFLEEFMKPMGITQYRLAKETDVPPRRINEIVHRERAITADTALRLAKFFGTSERTPAQEPSISSIGTRPLRSRSSAWPRWSESKVESARTSVSLSVASPRIRCERRPRSACSPVKRRRMRISRAPRRRLEKLSPNRSATPTPRASSESIWRR